MIKPSELHVISVLSNPVRYESRARLFKEFVDRMKIYGITHWIVEAAFGEREYEITNDNDKQHIRLRCDHELWIKEAMINAAMRHIPRHVKYVMWMDADIAFLRPNWAMETLHALQNYKVVQPFSHAIDLGKDSESLHNHTSFAHRWCTERQKPGQKYAPHMHPGYAWAWRKEAWDGVGGMIDFAICGAGDHHMACALAGHANVSIPGGLHPNYGKKVLQWEERAKEHVGASIGVVPGTILHFFHGHKADRKYQDRWQILQRNNFDPERDITFDAHGMPMLRGNKPQLRDDLKRYFRERNEDV